MNTSNREHPQNNPLERKAYPTKHKNDLGGTVQWIFIQHKQTSSSDKKKKYVF